MVVISTVYPMERSQYFEAWQIVPVTFIGGGKSFFFLSFISRSDLLTRFIALSLSHTVLLSAVTVKSKLHPNFAKSKENYKIYFLSTHPTNRAQTLIKNRPNRIDRDLTLQSNKGLSGIFMPKKTWSQGQKTSFLCRGIDTN